MPNEADGHDEKPGPDKKAAPRILVVDDERVNLTVAQRVLSDAGYEVAIAASGAEALKIADTQSSFDLFLIDILMPEMHGDELVKTFLLRFPNAKVLYFTGHSGRLFQSRNLLSEREALIDKPVTMSSLLQAVSMSLFGHTQGLASKEDVPPGGL
jgi:CheY-like chemotaxis protein